MNDLWEIIIRNPLGINVPVFFGVVVLAVLCSRDCHATLHKWLSDIASHAAIPLMETESLSECMTHNKNQAWFYVGICQAFYQNQNHPENAKSVSDSKPSSNPVEQSVVSGASEKIETSQLNQAEQDRKTLIRVGWSILLYLSIRDQAPTLPAILWLPLSILAATLLMQLDNLYEFASKNLAWYARKSDTQNPPASSAEKTPCNPLKTNEKDT
jgi:hypothetical protein